MGDFPCPPPVFSYPLLHPREEIIPASARGGSKSHPWKSEKKTPNLAKQRFTSRNSSQIVTAPKAKSLSKSKVELLKFLINFHFSCGRTRYCQNPVTSKGI